MSSIYPNHEKIIPLDDLPDDRLIDALALLSGIRAGIAPRHYLPDSPSGRVLADLIAASVVRVIHRYTDDPSFAPHVMEVVS